MQQSDTINLLISCESQAQLEAYLAIFRDAGHVTRAHRVSSLRDLGELLRDPQWDLLITTEKHPELSPLEALAALAGRASDLPCIVRVADPRAESALACLRQGAREAVGNDENERLVLAAMREVRALREHRELGSLRVQYEETARRAELLLAASQDAIAYVVDGMHVHANELYASLFGYPGVEDIGAVGLVDLIAESRQKEFKDALRRYRAHPEEQTAIDFTGVRADGGEFPGQLVLSTASFEGEPCMQVMVRASAPVASPATLAPAAAAAAAPASGGGMAALRAALGSAADGQLLLIGVEGYVQHCRNLGVVAATRLIDELGAFIAEASAWSQPPARVADAVLATVLPRTDSEGAADTARRAVDAVANHIHAVGSQSVTCSIAVVVCPLDGMADNGVEFTIDRGWSALLAGAERSAALRSGDPSRVQVLKPPAAATPEPSRAAGGATLADAVKQHQFSVLYQPIVSLRGDTSEYYEVHVMHTASGKPAATWLAEAQQAEASVELDKWVVIESLKKLAAHRQKHASTRMILPLGAGAVLDAEFGGWLALALRGAELPADSIAIQISHRAVCSYLRQAKQLAEKLQAMGCPLSVSDVHTANNPIADLAHLKPQFARMDAALSQALKDPEGTNTLLKPLIESLHQEQIASIMPDVEGAGVLAVLWQLGVNYIQGDYLQKPQPDMHYEFTDLA